MTASAAKRTESNGNPADQVTKQPREHERGTTGDAPRYAAIKRFIHDAIEGGALKAGDRVPSEAELVTRFGVSRMTANRALRELQSAGVLVRRAGSGSFVAEAKPIGHMIEIRNIADEVRAGRRTAVDTVTESLARIRSYNDDVDAFQVVRSERALAEAVEVDARPDRGTLPLAGEIDVEVETAHGEGKTRNAALNDAAGLELIVIRAGII